MGSAASKQRKLSKVVTSASEITRTKVNQLPSESLREKFQTSNVPSAKEVAPTSSSQVPSGKDGFDPHESGTSTYNDQFVTSINNLGKQIHSHSLPSKSPHSIALNQLKSRKQLFAKGQAEADLKDKTVVSPRVLTSILTDLYDDRISPEEIAKEYELNEGFLKELGSRFKVANTIVVLEEKVKEGEIGHREFTKNLGETGEGDGDDNLERMQKMRERIGLD